MCLSVDLRGAFWWLVLAPVSALTPPTNVIYQTIRPSSNLPFLGYLGAAHARETVLEEQTSWSSVP